MNGDKHPTPWKVMNAQHHHSSPGELLQPHHPTPSFDIESRCHITNIIIVIHLMTHWWAPLSQPTSLTCPPQITWHNDDTMSWQQQCDNGQSNDRHNNIRQHNKRRGASPWLMYLSSRLHSVQCTWPFHPPIVGFWPPKPCTNPYPHPWNTLTHGKGTGLHWVRVKVGVKTPAGYLCPSLLIWYLRCHESWVWGVQNSQCTQIWSWCMTI